MAGSSPAMTKTPVFASTPASPPRSFLWSGFRASFLFLFGGFTTNFIWCVLLNLKNRTGYQYFSSKIRSELPKREQETIIETPFDAPSEEVVLRARKGNYTEAPLSAERVPMLSNYLFSALAGMSWYLQFFFYTMGERQMGKFSFASWTLHMASIIIFSTAWGFYFHEWRGSSKKALFLIAGGIATLVFSTSIIGFGTWLKGRG